MSPAGGPAAARYRALGAAGTMGASAHLLQLGEAGSPDAGALLLDAGLDPRTGAGPDLRAAQSACPRAIVLSHAHLDHCGSLPLVCRRMPGVPVFATPATRDLATLVLKHRLGREHALAGRGGLPYAEAEVDALPWRCLPLGVRTPLWAGGPVLTFFEAGHLLGSASVLLEAPGHRTASGLLPSGDRVFFTGDIHVAARVSSAAARLPEAPVDLLLLESTQGANPALDGVEQAALEHAFLAAIEARTAAGGRVLVPTFALGKAQELTALLVRGRAAGRLSGVPIYLGGLAARVNRLADRHRADTEPRLADLGARPVTDALARQLPPGPALFLVGSGMLAEGSLAARLAAQITATPGDLVLFVGYLDPETPGFDLREQAAAARCAVQALPFSAHARRSDLLAIAARLRPMDVVLVHGDESARSWLRAELRASLPGSRVHCPQPGEVLVLGEAGPGP